MLLVVDIGNTNIVWGVYIDHRLAGHWRIATDVKKTPDEYGLLFKNLLTAANLSPQRLTETIIASVVPMLTGTIEQMLRQYFSLAPLLVTSEMDTGLIFRYDNPKEIGSDRIVNAAAAYQKYSRDLIIVDFGTATTFCVITAAGEYLGGVIAPGLEISAEALFLRAAKLIKVDFLRPKSVIGTDTASSIQAGLLFGYAGLVDTVVRRIEDELGRSTFVIGTGGLSSILAEETRSIQKIEPLLTLEGLALLHQRAQGASLSASNPTAIFQDKSK